MSNLISIGLSGLNSSQAALAVTSNNIANVATSGYSRQQTVNSAGALQNIGVGYLGTGTTISDVRRIYNGYLENQLQMATSLSGDASAYLNQITSVDKLLADSTTGISSVLSSFFASLQTASAAPADLASRQLLLTNAQTLSNRFNSIASQMKQQNDSINGQLTTLTDQVNKLTAGIADLNQQITQLSAAGTSPNSLLDARNEAVRSLNELVGVTVQEREGVYDVYLGTGQSLVTGNRSNTLSVVPGVPDASQYSVKVNYQDFSSDVTSVIAGGEIGGLLRYRSDVLIPAQNELGRVALVVADSINTQLGQGLDANGQFGASLFSSINSDLAMSQRSLASSNNEGSGSLNVTIAKSGQLSIYDYQVTFTSPTTYSVMRSDGTSKGSFDITKDPAPVIDGFSLALNKDGELKEGDSFKIIPTRSAASTITTTMTDANTLAFAGAITASTGTGNGGTGTVTPPALSSALDIYGADLAENQAFIRDALPVKMVFGEASNGTQAYTVYDAKGNTVDAGTISPGQASERPITVTMRDEQGNPILGADGKPKSFEFKTTVSGAPANGDSFTFAFNVDGKSDNRNAQSLLNLQTKAAVGTDSGTGSSFTSAYASLVERVGAKASQAQIDTSATGAILTSAKSSRDSVSGVNLDDEAASLVKFQQYYTASSQIIKAAQETFSILINAL